jgi:hypothetical protein
MLLLAMFDLTSMLLPDAGAFAYADDDDAKAEKHAESGLTSCWYLWYVANVIVVTVV